MPFTLFRLVPHSQVAALDATKHGNLSSGDIIAQDLSTGDFYVKLSTGWTQITNGNNGSGGTSKAVPLSGAVTIKNSAGSVTRSVTLTNGTGNLAATDAIVANGDSLVLKKSDGATTSSGNATLNSPATAVVSAGVVQNAKASA